MLHNNARKEMTLKKKFFAALGVTAVCVAGVYLGTDDAGSTNITPRHLHNQVEENWFYEAGCTWKGYKYDWE